MALYGKETEKKNGGGVWKGTTGRGRMPGKFRVLFAACDSEGMAAARSTYSYTAIEDCMFRKNNSINLEFHRISRQLAQLLWACLRESDETRPHYRLPSVPVIYLCVCHVFVHALFHEHELTENTTDMQVLNLMTSVTFHWPEVFTYYIYMYTTYGLVVE